MDTTKISKFLEDDQCIPDLLAPILLSINLILHVHQGYFFNAR